MKLRIKTLRRVIREVLKKIKEVDLDPSNNPGRPDDAFDYLGMHPSPEMAMAHPGAGGGTTSLSGGSGSEGEASAGPSEEPGLEVT